ncbi:MULTISPECIES: ABC transporter ATP-binding protein [unclassified Clostridium]|uniref:ABC transporter ATP-binding protein n=1 Tax=unclassified Clostridium TaxID=2614128 RepID=UPI0002974A55|nr:MULTISPECIES: ABC transporter ATP-binding protein [unclassified Clostridium]EKQ56926.1 MAG: ABC-type multidrug transport system, ATPase and permease component [Clostridium sp. Maddingley MBC34-26]
MLKIARFLKDYKKQVILGPIFKLIEAIFELIVPIIMAKIIDIGVHNKDINYVLKMGLILLIIGIISLSSALICQKYASIASQGFGTTVRNELFAHLNTFSYKEIDKFGTSSLITRITNDVNQLQLAVAMLIRLVIRAPFLALGAVMMAMILDLKLSLIFLIATPLIVLILYIVIKNSIPYFKLIQKKLDKISLTTRENLEGVRVIRAFSKQKYEEAKFNDFNEDLSDTAIKVGKLSSLLNPATYIVLNFSIIAIIWFGGIRVDSGDLTQGQIIAFVNYITQILLALIVVSNLVVIFTKASASAARVNELFDTSSSIRDNIDQNYIEPIEGNVPKVELKNVSFSYDNSNKYSLDNISVKIYPNETIGIIGGTGSGKSTLINLICRFYDVSIGNIFIDGHNIKDYTLIQLKNKIKIVPQTATLFTGTIAENIRLGNPKASSEDIKRCLKIAQASEFVDKLPKRCETHLDQGGKNLSGGQKQRLTIARALLCNPDILILDDSFSALDFSTDAKLRNSLRNELQNKATVIITSQRISTIKNADKILVLDDGNLLDAGTHDELFNRCSIYREIVISQNNSER